MSASGATLAATTATLKHPLAIVPQEGEVPTTDPAGRAEGVAQLNWSTSPTAAPRRGGGGSDTCLIGTAKEIPRHLAGVQISRDARVPGGAVQPFSDPNRHTSRLGWVRRVARRVTQQATANLKM